MEQINTQINSLIPIVQDASAGRTMQRTKETGEKQHYVYKETICEGNLNVFYDPEHKEYYMQTTTFVDIARRISDNFGTDMVIPANLGGGYTIKPIEEDPVLYAVKINENKSGELICSGAYMLNQENRAYLPVIGTQP